MERWWETLWRTQKKAIQYNATDDKTSIASHPVRSSANISQDFSSPFGSVDISSNATISYLLLSLTLWLSQAFHTDEVSSLLGETRKWSTKQFCIIFAFCLTLFLPFLLRLLFRRSVVFISFSLGDMFFCQQVTSGCEAVWRLITNCCWETIDVNSSSSSLDTNFIIEKSAHNVEKKESQIFPSFRCRELFLWPRKKKTPANRRELHSLSFFWWS